ncbi:MAG: macro domain-containing protein [Minisyncoccia bacterium]
MKINGILYQENNGGCPPFLKMIKAVCGSILEMETDIIVNPVNEELITGGGVDRLICKTIGTPIELAKRAIGKCPTGEAVHTSGFNLKARYIIHTTAPRFYTLKPYPVPREELLAACYVNSLELARELKAKSIAFPALGTGAYNWPHRESAEVALTAIKRWLESTAYDVDIYFVLADEKLISTYQGH